jgi:hypothetical protein
MMITNVRRSLAVRGLISAIFPYAFIIITRPEILGKINLIADDTSRVDILEEIISENPG